MEFELPRPEEVLAALIRIDSTNPPGNETGVARYLRDLFFQYGLQGEIIEPVPGRGSFVARLGEGGRKLLYLSHTDVVPSGDKWSFPPLCGEIRDGYVLGRGAIDCKGLVAAQACSVLSLAAGGGLAGTLIFAATADEEAGGGHGVGYLLRHHREKIDADFAINEGALEPCVINGKKYYFIQVGEKGTAWTKLTARGISCHGSMPGLGTNAVSKMVAALSSLASYQPEIILLDEVRRLIEDAGYPGGTGSGIHAGNVDAFIAGFRDPWLAEYLRSLTRLTISPNVIRGGVKTNIVPDECSAEVDIRVLPGQGPDYVKRELKRCLGSEIEIEMPYYEGPAFSPVKSGEYDLIKESMGALIESGAGILPCISTGATDSRWLREYGIPSYGISVMAPDFDKELRLTIHGADERIDVNSLRLHVKFLTRLAGAYLG